jgi:hypothetical protein
MPTTTKTARVRWECPTGQHPAILASTRPARDAIVRYCLKCSEATGKLTPRVAPALERKRAAAAESAAAKAKAARAKAAAAKIKAKAAEDARYTVEGVDLRKEMTKLLKLRIFGGTTGRLFRNPPDLVISRRSSAPTSRYGYAEHTWSGRRISICTWPGLTLADARETLVHELVHHFVGLHRGHDEVFRQTMTKAFREAYKVLPVGVGHNVYHGRYAAALRRREQS